MLGQTIAAATDLGHGTSPIGVIDDQPLPSHAIHTHGRRTGGRSPGGLRRRDFDGPTIGGTHSGPGRGTDTLAAHGRGNARDFRRDGISLVRHVPQLVGFGG